MFTLCSEVCRSNSESHPAGVRDAPAPAPEGASEAWRRASEEQMFKRESGSAQGGAAGKGCTANDADDSPKRAVDDSKRLRQPRASMGNVDGGVALASLDEQPPPSQLASSPADEPPKQPGVAGPFGVVRQVSASSILQKTLNNDVKARGEELARAQREEEQRAALVVTLEQEVFEKERRLAELRAHMEELGGTGELTDGALPEASVSLHPEGLAAKERERLTREIQVREGEASDLRERVGALEELIREKRAEVVAKGEATLQLLFQLSCNATQQRIGAGNPLMQATPAVVTDGEPVAAPREIAAS